MSNRGKPCLGFPTRIAAIEALMSEGLAPIEIAERTGIAASNVAAQICKIRQRTEGRPDRRPIASTGWTPAKHQKAIRLYAAIIEMVAKALQVPPAELLALWSKGTLPPMGSARLNEIDGTARPAAATGGKVERIAPPQAQPRHTGDSAGKVRLKAPDGRYVHWSGEILTNDPAQVWEGTRDQAAALRIKSDIVDECAVVPAPVWAPRDKDFERAVLR